MTRSGTNLYQTPGSSYVESVVISVMRLARNLIVMINMQRIRLQAAKKRKGFAPQLLESNWWRDRSFALSCNASTGDLLHYLHTDTHTHIQTQIGTRTHTHTHTTLHSHIMLGFEEHSEQSYHTKQKRSPFCSACLCIAYHTHTHH